MASHNVVTLHRPRTLAHVLLDLREARRDWEDADRAFQAVDSLDSAEADDISDRMGEADQRIDRLRGEFATRFEDATGLTWRQVEQAIEGGVL